MDVVAESNCGESGKPRIEALHIIPLFHEGACETCEDIQSKHEGA